MRNILGFALAVTLVAAPAWADAYIPGDFNGWNASEPMTETSPAGFYEYDIPVQGANERKQFVLLRYADDWSDASKYIPSGDQWCYTDDTGNLHITFDTNLHDDGWFPQTYRVGVSDWIDTWTAVGDWQGWDNANAATAMTDTGGGLFKYETTGLDAGTHWYKAVRTGSWDAVGGNGLSVNADNFEFAVNNPSEIVTFWVDASNSTISVDVIPEPTSLVLLGLGAFTLLRRR